MQYVRWNRPGEVWMNLCDLGRTELETLIDEWIIGKNSAIERTVLKLRLLDGMTFEHLAELVDRSPRQARTIYHRAEEKLFKHFPG